MPPARFPVAIGVATAIGLAGSFVAAQLPALPGIEYAGIPLGIAVGWSLRGTIRSHRDLRAPVAAALIAGGSIFAAQLFVLATWGDRPFLVAIGVEAVIAAFATTAERLRAFDVGAAQAAAHEDMRDLQRRTEAIEARPKPGLIRPGARLRCAGCDEMVDAARTELDPDRGLLCEDCHAA